jgi:CheY-like chemotaxis protein
MSVPSLSEHLALLRQHVRLVVERTGDHTHLVEELAASAERDLRRVETAAAHATTADVDARSLLSGHVRQTAAGAATARRLCVSAHAQHAAACRLLADLDERSAEVRRPNAVLVVDDYGEVRELVASVLRDAGFVVTTAANGLEGLIAAYEMRPGIIVMDVAMPVLDGIEATRLIKAGEATRDARVIAYTGNPSLESAVVNGLFAAVLQKPATPDDVVATVQHVASL